MGANGIVDNVETMEPRSPQEANSFGTNPEQGASVFEPLNPNLDELLLDEKLELVSLQIEILKREHEARKKQNAEEHELEMLILRNQCSNSRSSNNRLK